MTGVPDREAAARCPTCGASYPEIAARIQERASRATTSGVHAGAIDRASGEPCGWANGTMDCKVPGCKFSSERCVLVQRERMERAS